MKKVLITAAEYPDLDGVACAIAYAQYLQQKDSTNIYIPKFGKGLHNEPTFILNSLGIKGNLLDDQDQFDEFIIVDACEPLGLPPIIDFSKVIDVIDHRLFPDYKAFPNAKFRIEPVGAAATQIAEFFYFDTAVHLDKNNAALLLCAIYSNTVNFKSDTTTFRDMRMKKWLETKIHTEHQGLPQRMFEHKTHYVIDHLEEVMKTDMHDNCNQFGEGICGVMYQIEINDAAHILNRKEELLGLTHRIKPKRDYQMVIIQDVVEGKTTIISDNHNVIEALAMTSLKGIAHDNIYTIPRITMRKSIKKALLERKEYTH
jgi:manganese-dependent inorganic pyrophosphatase